MTLRVSPPDAFALTPIAAFVGNLKRSFRPLVGKPAYRTSGVAALAHK